VILEDLLKVLLWHGLKPSQELRNQNFTVEMETGQSQVYPVPAVDSGQPSMLIKEDEAADFGRDLESRVLSTVHE
jgi:hypothetical protein